MSFSSCSLKALALGALCLVFCSCGPKGPENPYAGLEKISFTEDDSDFANPERGFFSHLEFFSSKNPAPLSKTVLEGARISSRSLIYTIYYLDSFIDSPISEEFLAGLRQGMQNLRESGVKCVLRFAYDRSYKTEDLPWDATEQVVMQHISQLKPIFQEYYDVIFCLEAGFIGTFGEWYYTDNFGTTNKPDYDARRRVVEALMDALPAQRQILIRYPQAKMRMFGWTEADSLTVETAHDGSVKSRLGHHNDCFVSSENDVGTYHSSSERPYVYTESRYTIWGGETCALVSQSKNINYVQRMVAAHHMTYLNSSYHQSVIGHWRNEGILDEITKRMGYRLVLEDAYVEPKPVHGEPMRLVLNIRNDGYAAPQNPRLAEIVFVSEDGKKSEVRTLDVDPRFWFEGKVSTVDVEVEAPAEGSWNVCLNLPDPAPTLKDNPLFSIRLANKDVWNKDKGYNLITSITVK